MSPTFKAMTSLARSPVPKAIANAVWCFQFQAAFMLCTCK